MKIELDLDAMAEELLEYVRRGRIISGLSIFYTYILKHDEIIDANLVHDSLRDLVKKGIIKQILIYQGIY